MAIGKGNHEHQSEAPAGSTARRFAEHLHEEVDRIAERGERLESRLHDGREHLGEEARRLNASVAGLVRRSPWLVLGGSIAIGFLIGALGRRH